MTALRIGIIGYAGRMGQAIGHAVSTHPRATLAGGVVIETPPEPIHGEPMITNDAEKLFPRCDVMIDFSSPAATPDYARMAARHGVPFMSGTTGLSDKDKDALSEVARHIPLLYAANTSLSLVVMKQLTTLAARLLRDDDYDITILDRHHRLKKDAPSGTAKSLAEAVTAGNGGHKEPSLAAFRAGFIVGEHEVSFVGEGETITLTHTVTDRAIFARGALQAALWLHGREPGLYGMNDVLGID